MNEVRDEIKLLAVELGIDPALFEAICTVESHLRTGAVRFESYYPYLYRTGDFAKLLGITQDTESALQRFSYGPGQVMGAVCREYGYKDSLLNLVFDWRMALRYSALHLQRFLKQRPNMKDAVACYNAGSVRKLGDKYVNQVYVDKVMTELQRIALG